MPQTTCIVPHCSRPGDHILPKDPDRQKLWIHAIRRGNSTGDMWTPTSRYSYVCRHHFTEDDYTKITSHGTEAERRCLKKNAVPSIFKWTSDPSPLINARRCRYEARSNSSKRRRLEDAMGQNGSDDSEMLVLDSSAIDVGAMETIVTESDDLIISAENITEETEVTFRPVQTQTLPQPLLSIENFRNDEAGIHFYTGLETYCKVLFVLNTLGPAAYWLNYAYAQVTNITVPDQFFLVLMKLRRHTTNFELSRLFCVSENTVKNIFLTWITFMSKQWKELDLWPSKELTRYFCPSGFRVAYPTTRVIVDGTECPIKKPKNPTSQQATFSTYKNRNTVKVLVGASPGGLISFVSGAFAGSTSDRQIVERSALVQLCEPSDSIMADKGFNVQDLFATRDVTVNIPTFFKKKNRMNCSTVLKDRKIASKRVHIERLIGLAKTYKILTHPMTATETKLSSEIIYVCFTLCNFRKRIITKHA